LSETAKSNVIGNDGVSFNMIPLLFDYVFLKTFLAKHFELSNGFNIKNFEIY
jgi:hypothetical protein